MKLARGTSIKQFPTFSTSGHWVSADGRFVIYQDRVGWRVGPKLPDGLQPSFTPSWQRAHADSLRLCAAGVKQAHFRTRRDAVAALESVFASEGVTA